MKPPSQSQTSPVFEGVYNNARLLHFLTAVVGSTCHVRVKSGAVYAGIFKTLSAKCELAVDAVHKQSDGGGSGSLSTPPKMEDITDTMIFSPSDLVTMTCRDVDLSSALRDTFTDSAISSSRLNGGHQEKELQRWGGEGDGDDWELASDTSNGWDANEMFRFNEETYGVKSTYDSNLSSYTMPLERGSSDAYWRREARAARLAGEIESSLQYRRRVSLENDEGRDEEEKFSAVVRETEDRGGQRQVILLHQRSRHVRPSAGSIRTGASGQLAAPGSSSPKLSSDGSSLLPIRTASLPHQSQNNHTPPHQQMPVNGVSSRTSQKSPTLQSNRILRSTAAASRSPKPDGSPRESSLVSPTYSDSSLKSPVATTAVITKPCGPTPLFPVDVKEILDAVTEERTGSLPGQQEVRSSKGKEFREDGLRKSYEVDPVCSDLQQCPTAPLVQQRGQLEELRKFGKDFRLQSSPPSADLPPPDSPASSPSPSPPKPSATFGLQPRGEEGACHAGGDHSEASSAQVKYFTLNPNAKEFLPVQKPAASPTPPPPSPSVVPPPPGQAGPGSLYSSTPGPYLSYVTPVPIQGHSIQPPQVYQYMSAVSQPKYPRPKGPVVGLRPDHHASSSSPLIAAAGPPLVASPYPQSYLPYGQVIQALPPHYHGQPIYSMLQGAVRMLTSGAPPEHMGLPGPQYPSQAEGSPGLQQAGYAPPLFHSGPIHPPHPPSTPTGNQHSAPSPGQAQVGQGGPQPQFPSGGLLAPTAPILPQGHSSPQTAFPMQGYSLPAHSFSSISQLPQVHIAAGMPGPHPSTRHGPPPIMLHYVPPQQSSGPNRHHGPGTLQHFYIGPPQAVQVQAHPSQQMSFHTSSDNK